MSRDSSVEERWPHKPQVEGATPSPATNDNYEEAVSTLNQTCIKLCGGYYEPKSIRDAQLSYLLFKFLEENKLLKL